MRWFGRDIEKMIRALTARSLRRPRDRGHARRRDQPQECREARPRPAAPTRRPLARELTARRSRARGAARTARSARRFRPRVHGPCTRDGSSSRHRPRSPPRSSGCRTTRRTKSSARRRDAGWDAASQTPPQEKTARLSGSTGSYNVASAVTVPSTGRRSRALPSFLFGRPLGGREGFETLVRNRLSALDREAVCTGGKTGLGTLDGGELVA